MTAPADAPDLTIIIVSYETREMTLACIRSVVTQTAGSYELIVLDNASTDGSAAAIREAFPDITLIALTENIGFARANNLAARHARGRRLLLLNPDTVVLDHAIDRLHAFAETRPVCGIWGGRTVFADGRLNPASCWRRASLWSIFCLAFGLTRLPPARLFNREGYGGWRRDTVRAVDIVTGCFFLIDRTLWERCKGFDPLFFMYGEEADLCIRAHAFGARPAITPEATIIHYGGASDTDRAEQRVKVLAGRISLMQRHEPAAVVFAGRLLYRALPLLRIAVAAVGWRLLGRSDLRQTEQKWRHVWQERARWLHGWSEAAIAEARRLSAAGA